MEATSSFDTPDEGIHRFRAATPRAALAAVKAALGPTAEILACSEVGGTLLRRKEIEVLARMPIESAPEPVPVLPSLHTAARAFGFKPFAENITHRAPRSREPRKKPAQQREDGEHDPVRALVERGIDYALASEIADRIVGVDDEETLRNARRHLRSRVTVSRPPWHPDPTNERSVIALIGPTGVGKTTTAAKIGARAVMEYGLRVAMITVDHHRVGAVHQLGRYGELMNIPVVAARSRSEFERALDVTSDADLVIIDTAGRSPSDHDINAQQASLLRLCPWAERHFVIPAASSGAHLTREFARYHPMAPQRIIISKVDEADGAAAALSVAARIDLPVSALTDGQRVPEDLKRVNVEWLLDSLSISQGK